MPSRFTGQRAVTSSYVETYRRFEEFERSTKPPAPFLYPAVRSHVQGTLAQKQKLSDDIKRLKELLKALDQVA